jgi:hypothetical protein
MTMRYEDAAAPRYLIETRGGVEQIRIKQKGAVFVALFMGVWLTLWTVGGATAIATLAAHFNLFLIFWLCGWALGWLFVASTLAWQVFGSETLRVVGSDLEISHKVFNFEKSKLYRGTDIRHLSGSAAPDFFRGVRISNPFIRLTQRYDSGSVKFTYGARTIYAAGGLDEAEGRLIADWLSKRLPRSATE